jgi:hypothetical protein
LPGGHVAAALEATDDNLVLSIASNDSEVVEAVEAAAERAGMLLTRQLDVEAA